MFTVPGISRGESKGALWAGGRLMSTERTFFRKHGTFAMLAGGAVRGGFVEAAHLQHIHQVIVRQLLRLFSADATDGVLHSSSLF